MVTEEGPVTSFARMIISRFVIAILVMMLAGCAGLHPGGGSLGDASVSVHVLQSQTREAQRIIAEMRAELDAGRKTLAASHTARARVEGQLREAQRRYDEARQVIGLQREELSRLRDEREEVLRASRDLRRYMTRLQRQIAALVDSRGGGPAVPRPSPVDSQFDVRSSQDGRPGAPMPVNSRAGVEDSALDLLAEGVRLDDQLAEETGIAGVVVVRRGDTLSKLAQRYRVSYPELRSLNGLEENPDLIFVGQRLLLPK